MTVAVDKSLLSRLPDLVRLMASGGDGRIRLDPATGLNRYHSAPQPREMLAFASSTANDVSADAFAHAGRVLAAIGADPPADAYAAALERLRRRIRRAYGLDEAVAIMFAPSGTDLEYVALACVRGRAAQGTHAVLLGADEVGSGCIHSAHGRHFAEQTALGVPTRAGEPVAGLGDGVEIELVDVPVRDPDGRVRPSARIAEAIAAADAGRRHRLIHVVHGSKTGLILPSLDDIDRLRRRFAGAATFVVDACQARITGAAVRDYLARDAIVFVTGSKFMGGPPFSGFALVPREMAERAAPLPHGLATLFRRAEWPAGWPGAERLEESANAGLLLRLEASIFELERFQRLAPAEAERVILAFHAAVRAEIVDKSPARRVAPYPPGEREEADTHPIEMRTLSTLDLSGFGGGGATFEQAQSWHAALLAHGVRLGQPVKCVKLADGRWGATLRIGLAMGQIVARAGLSDAELGAGFAGEMARVRRALEAVAG